MTDSQTVVSVIIPVHDAEAYLGGLLECLCHQRVSEAWEVVVVDNRSTDRSRAIATAFIGRLPLRILDARVRANPSYARNAGARVAIGSKLIFVDADDEVGEGYVEYLAKALDEHPLVTSAVDSVSLNPPWVQEAHGAPWQTHEVGVFFGFLPAAGVNLGVRRSVFEEVGGFPEAFSGSEDVAFSWRAQMCGVGIHLVPQAVYRYRYRLSLRQLFRQAANWGRDSVLLFTTFRAQGMPPRAARDAWREWLSAAGALVAARGRRALAPAVVRLGFCAGRLSGSVRYRTLYL